MNISVRQLEENDWALYRDIRLLALRTDPGVFGSTYEGETLFDEDRWRSIFRSSDKAVFMLFDTEKPVGICGIGRMQDNPKAVIFVADWILPDYRGKGLARLFFKTRFEWVAKRNDVEKIIIAHRESNVAERHLTQSHGFNPISSEMRDWNDGTRERIVWNELKLRV